METIDEFFDTPECHNFLDMFLGYITTKDLKERKIKQKILEYITLPSYGGSYDGAYNLFLFLKRLGKLDLLMKYIFPASYQRYELSPSSFEVKSYNYDTENKKFIIKIKFNNDEKTFKVKTSLSSYASKIKRILKEVYPTLSSSYISKCYGLYIVKNEKEIYITDKNFVKDGYRKIAAFNYETKSFSGTEKLIKSYI